MTTSNHTDIASGAAANAAIINAPLGQLDAAIGAAVATLTTTSKTLVGAVNELNTQIDYAHYSDGTHREEVIADSNLAANIKVGSLALLTTATKSNVVAAINELVVALADVHDFLLLIGGSWMQFTYEVTVDAGQTTTPKFLFNVGYPTTRIDWGDGTLQETVTSGVELTHTYSSGGTYNVRLNMPNQDIWITQIDLSYDYVTGLSWSEGLLILRSLTRFIDLWSLGYGEVGVLRIAGVSQRIMTFIGDSITIGTPTNPVPSRGYAYTLCYEYNGGRTTMLNHAASGNTIISNMDAQVAAAAGDYADVVIMALGTNDDNAGDMAALRAEVEENIAEIKASNGGANIYYMNVLPRWTNSGGGTVVAKNNIRTAISAACTAQSIICWDTFTTPWITAADTRDGTHPNDFGIAKISAEIISRLPSA